MPKSSRKQKELEPEPEEEEVELPKPTGKKKKRSAEDGGKKAKKSKKSAPVEEEEQSEGNVHAEEEEKERFEGEADEEQQEEEQQEEEQFEGEADEEQQVEEQFEEEEGEAEGEGEDGEEGHAEGARKKKMTRNRKAKLVGYRNLAKAAGFSDKYADDAMGSAGLDGQACLLSVADAVRCHRFVPATAGATTYGIDEYSKRHALFAKGVPAAAARESQANLDLVLRSAMNEATVRAMESGKKTISASMMQSVLRSAADNMLFTAVVPPLGLVRYGQSQGMISSTGADSCKKQEEKAEASKAKKLASEYDKAQAERRAAARKVREAKKAALVGAA